MSEKEYQPNTGVIFRNDQGDNPRRPDRRGKGEIDCPHCGKRFKIRISGWTRKRRTEDGNERFLSLSFDTTPRSDNNGN